MNFWRSIPNLSDFQSPKELGERWFATDLIQADTVFDTSRLKFRFYSSKEDDRSLGDFSYWRGGVFFVSERGYQALADLFNRHGRAYPIRCGRHPYYIVTVDHEIDAMDYDLSVFDRLGIYDDVRRDLFGVKKLALKADFHTDLDIFRLKGKPDIAFEIVVSDKFKGIYELAELTGLLFQKTR